MSEAEQKASPPDAGWPMLQKIKERGIPITAEDEEPWEDTPVNRIKLWFKGMKEFRSEVWSVHISWDSTIADGWTVQYFDKDINTHLNLVSATVSPTDPNISYVVFEMKIPRSLCNAMGNLHGGAVATIFDTTTSMCIAPVSRPGFWSNGHVSRIINCAYLRPAPEGTEILIECEVVHLGARMGMLKGRMVRKSDGKVCYTCEHQKATTDYKPSPKL